MSIVLIAHNQQRKVDDPEYGQLDRHDLKLHPKSAGVVAEVVDCVFFAKHKINVRKEEKVLEPRATEASIPGNECSLQLADHTTWQRTDTTCQTN